MRYYCACGWAANKCFIILSMKNNNRRLAVEFEQAANEIDAIFESYTELHNVYTQSFESISKELGGVVNNTEKTLLENKKGSPDGSIQRLPAPPAAGAAMSQLRLLRGCSSMPQPRQRSGD